MTTTDPKLIERKPDSSDLTERMVDAMVNNASIPFPAYTARLLTPIVAAAINEAAQKDRAGIVAWLRSLRDKPGLPAFGFKPHDLQGIYGDGFADAIERGDHLPPPPAIEAKESQHG